MGEPSGTSTSSDGMSWVQRNLDYAEAGGRIRFALILLSVALLILLVNPDNDGRAYAVPPLVGAMGVLIGRLRDMRDQG